MSAYTSVRAAQVKTWALAKQLTKTSADCCRGWDMTSPPWCLRLRPEYRTQTTRMFRNLVALAAWADRKQSRGHHNG